MFLLERLAKGEFHTHRTDVHVHVQCTMHCVY